MDFETRKRASGELPQVVSAQTLRDAPLNIREPTPPVPERHALIKSEASGVQLNLGELWHYRELLYFLTLRDIKVRYKQTLMGVAWVIIQPLTTVLIFTLVFNRFVRLDAGSLPYPLFALSGLLLWLFFANAVTNSTHSLVSNANLITKVYFPRMFIPAASVAAGLVDLVRSLSAVDSLVFLLWRRVDLEHPAAAAFRFDDGAARAGSGPVLGGGHGQIPRPAPRASLHHSALDVCLARYLPDEHCSGKDGSGCCW